MFTGDPSPGLSKALVTISSNQVYVFTTTPRLQRNQRQALTMTLPTDPRIIEGVDAIRAKTDGNWATRSSEPGFSLCKIGHHFLNLPVRYSVFCFQMYCVFNLKG